MSTEHTPRVRPELAAFVLCFALFALMAAPGITWMDAGELAAAGFTLGGAHPPGHPGHTLVARLAAFVPVGEVGFRMALLSAAAMAAAVAGLVALCRALLPGELAAASVAALMAALAPVVQLNATRVEVYAPVAALLVWATALVVRFVTPAERADRDGRLVLVAALACGLAAAIHPLIAASASAPLAVAVLARLVGAGPRRRLIPAALGLGVLGLATYLYLPVRAGAAHPPLLMWGEPTGASAFVDVLSAPAYRGNFAVGGVVERFVGLVFLCGEGMGAGLLWGGLAGLCFAALTGLRGAGVVLATAVAVIAGAATQQHMNPDMPGYVVVALLLMGAGLAPLVGAGVRMLSQESARPAVRHGVALVLLVPLMGFGLAAPTVRAQSGEDGFRRHDDALRWWSRSVALMPPGPGVYLAEHDHSLFAAQYERLVAGGRPDIAVANSELCRDRWFLGHVKRTVPALYVPYIDDGQGGDTAGRLVGVNLGRGRPVGGDEAEVAGAEPGASVPMGRGYRYGRRPVDPASLPPALPPPGYHGRVGARVGGLIATSRGRYELERGRLDQAVVAAGLVERFADHELDSATQERGPMLMDFVPRVSPVFIHEPWQTELLGDEVAWQAGLASVAPTAEDLGAHAPVERRLHARWRALLAPIRGGGPADRQLDLRDQVAPIAALGPDAEIATAQVLLAHDRDRLAELWVRDMIERRGEDHRALVLLASIIANRAASRAGNHAPSPALAEAEALFERAVDLAPRDARAEVLVRLGVARIQQGKRDAARRAWQRALELDPGRRDAAVFLRKLMAE